MPPKPQAKKPGQKGGPGKKGAPAGKEKAKPLTKKELDAQKALIKAQANAKLQLKAMMPRLIQARMASALVAQMRLDFWSEKCLVLGRVYRGHLGRRIVQSFRTPGHNRCATKIAATYRGHLGREQVRLGFTPKMEKYAILVQRAYRAAVTRYVLRQLKAIRCIPCCFAVAGLALHPVPDLFRECDVEAFRDNFERTLCLASPFFMLPPVWGERCWKYHRDSETGNFSLNVLMHTFDAAKVDASMCMDHFLRFVLETDPREPSVDRQDVEISLEQWREAFDRCVRFFRGEMINVQILPEVTPETEAYDRFQKKLAIELAELEELDDIERAVALLKLPREKRGRVLRRMDKLSLQKAIYEMDARNTRTIRKYITELATDRDEEAELFNARLTQQVNRHKKLFHDGRSPLRFATISVADLETGIREDDYGEDLVKDISTIQEYTGGMFHLVRHPLFIEDIEDKAKACALGVLELRSAIIEGEEAQERAERYRKQGKFEPALEQMLLGHRCFEYAWRLDCEGQIFFKEGKEWGRIRLTGPGSKQEMLETFLQQVQEAKEDIQAGKTPLHFAAESGNLGTIKYMLANKTPEETRRMVNAIDATGRTPLHAAVTKSHHAVVKKLISDYNAVVDLETFVGRTPVHLAADIGDFEMVRVLVESAAIVVNREMRRLKKREIPTHQMGYHAAERLGANRFTTHGMDARALAAAKRHTKVVELLDKLRGDEFDIVQGRTAPYAPEHHPEDTREEMSTGMLIRYQQEKEAARLILSRVGRPDTAGSQSDHGLAVLMGQFSLNLTVKCARDLIGKGREGKSDAYVEVRYCGDVYQTDVVRRSCDPTFNHTITLQVDPDQEGAADWALLELAVWDVSLGAEHIEFLGVIHIDVSDLRLGKTEKWFALHDDQEIQKKYFDHRKRLRLGVVRPQTAVQGAVKLSLEVRNEVSHLPLKPPGSIRHFFEAMYLPQIIEENREADKEQRKELLQKLLESEIAANPSYEDELHEKLEAIRENYRQELRDLMFASIITPNAATVSYCIEHGSDPNARNSKGNSALFVAAHVGDASVVTALVRGGAKTDFQTEEDGLFPLYQACIQGQEQAALALLQGGADANARTQAGSTSLMTCSHKGLDGVVRVLLENGADPNLPNRVGATSLHLAAFAEQHKCVDLLLTHGADATIRVASGPLQGRRPKDMTEDSETLAVFRSHKKHFLGVTVPDFL